MADCCISPLDCVKEVGKCIFTECILPPVKRHVDYWWCFDGNIQGLGDEIDSLAREKSSIDEKIEEARLDAKSITTEAENWTNVSALKLEEATRILQDCDNLKVWKMLSRYSVGKNAKTTAEGLEKHRTKGKSMRIAVPASPPSTRSTSHRTTMEFESRRRIEEDIMESLNDARIHVIAICGAGGVGKTAMVHKIMDRVKKDEIFDEVVTVSVGEKIELPTIQMKIAELLDLKFTHDTLHGRADTLLIRLMDSKKKLIIFDDVWKRFELEDIGVPFGNCATRCKIMLTSRVQDACQCMNAQKIIPMNVLTKDEAWALFNWALFNEKAGCHVECSDLRQVAEDVAAECSGLPIALVNVGAALKHKSISVWIDYRSQLRSSIPTDIPEFVENVYTPLKRSYYFLKNGSVEDLFLLCCLFSKDYDIPIEHLTLYGIGLDMFKNIRNIEEGRRRTHTFVEMLKSHFLLINGSREHNVKVHDVVRNMAIFIGSEEKDGFLKSLQVSSMDLSTKDSSRNCNWMSIDISIENAELPIRSGFRNLRLLMVLDSVYCQISEVFDANVICFKGMEGLKVLSFSSINLQILPSALKLLKTLRTLHLYDCAVKDVSDVGELASLEILCICNCHAIIELPKEIGRLNRLRLLELKRCSCLKRIVAGVISSLVRLEELKFIYCSGRLEAKGNQSEEGSACLSELESLRSLTCLEIDISDCNLVAEQICLSQQLVRYRISSSNLSYTYDSMEDERNTVLYLPGDITVGHWIGQLVRSTQSLYLHGDGSNNFNLAEIVSLRKLKFTNCSTVKKLVNAIGCKFPALKHLDLRDLEELEKIIAGIIPDGSNSFQELESLHVCNLPKLGFLWESPNQNVSLCKLKFITINKCPSLYYLFSLEAGRSLDHLQCLCIEDCETTEQVFWNEMERNTDSIEFPMLQELTLNNLPNLKTFSQGVEIIELPRLTKLRISKCPKLRAKIGKWNKRLQLLQIRNCDTIEEIFCGETCHIIFPELRELLVGNMQCLTAFYRGVTSIKFPKLQWMEIRNLPRLNSILPMDSETTHDDHSLHFLCNQKVEFPDLKKLRLFKLSDVINKIWCSHIPIDFLHCLESLYISDVNGIKDLMSSSIAKNLVNLKYLYIQRCQEMVEVLADEREVFAMSPFPLFPNLNRLCITSLHKLRRFCQWKHAFELPLLREVKIIDCPGMETFTPVSLSTPKLSKFYLNEKQIEMKDLNRGIHHFRTSVSFFEYPLYNYPFTIRNIFGFLLHKLEQRLAFISFKCLCLLKVLHPTYLLYLLFPNRKHCILEAYIS